MDNRQQIAKLKEMLAELGMEGRYSMEKAKEIKAKREFEQELADVQQFAQAVQKQGRRRSAHSEEVASEKEESEDEEPVVKRRRSAVSLAMGVLVVFIEAKRLQLLWQGNAKNSIAAFLQEQSDDSD